MKWTEWVKANVVDGLKQMNETDLRWSYIAIGVMAVVGGVANIYLPNGWTVWPMILAVAILVMLQEASVRNTEEVPPLHVYALFGSVVAVWVVVTFALRAVDPLILVGGLGALLYVVARQVIKQREKMRLIEFRRSEGKCIHCGEAVDPTSEYCGSCGEEPDPDSTRLKCVAGVAQSLKRTERLRAALKPEAPTAAASRKEKALIARRNPNRKGGKS